MLEDLKSQVILTAQQAQRMGLMKHRSGNVSARDPETGYIVVTPSGTDREQLQINDMCVLTKDLALLEGGKPSSESLMHVACYRVRDDIGAIVHTHSRFATAFAVLNRPIPAFASEMSMFVTKTAGIPVAPFGPPGSMELAEKVAGVIRENNACLMEKHGAMAAAKTLEDALLTAAYIEEFAEVYYYALQIGGGKEPAALTKEEMDTWTYPAQLKGKG